MCTVRDAAIYIANEIIDLCNGDAEDAEKYTVDFYKVHKLLYYAQGLMLVKYNKPMFKNEISAHVCGVCIDGMDDFYAIVGSEEIKQKILNRISIPITPDRQHVLKYIAKNFGKTDRDELIHNTKEHEIYNDVKDKITDDCKPIISQETIKSFFEKNYDSFFGDFDDKKAEWWNMV